MTRRVGLVGWVGCVGWPIKGQRGERISVTVTEVIGIVPPFQKVPRDVLSVNG